MANYNYGAIALTGGAAGAVDAIPSAGLQDKDGLVAIVPSDKYYVYEYDANSGAAESSPDVIKPDDIGGGNGRWLLVASYDAILRPTLTNKSGAITVEGYVYRIDPDNDESFDYGTEYDETFGTLPASFQVAVGPSTTIANNASGTMYVGGYCDVHVTGDTLIGDYLYFSGTNGKAKPISQLYEQGCFGRAVEARSGDGLVKAEIFNKDGKVDNPTRWSWGGHIRIPKGKPTPYGSIIINVGGVGTWNEKAVQPQSAGWDAANNRWILFVLGKDSGGVNSMGLYFCDEADFPHGPWTEYGSNPVFEKAPAVAWDDGEIALFNVEFDQQEQEWRMYYRGKSGAAKRTVGTATAPDAITWTRDPAGQPLLAIGANDKHPGGCVVKGNLYLLFVAESNVGMKLYEGDDAIDLKNNSSSLTISVPTGGSAAWRAVTTFGHSAFFDQGILYVWYSGLSGAPPFVYQVGMMTNKGDLYTYQDDLRNPLLAPSGSETDVAYSIMTKHKGQFHLIYGTSDDQYVTVEISVATIGGVS